MREERSFGKLPVTLWDVWTVYVCFLLFDGEFQEVPAASHLSSATGGHGEVAVGPELGFTS